MEAFHEWLDVDDYDGFRSVNTLYWSQSSGEYLISMEDLNGYGATSCPDKFIKLDDSLLNNDVLLATIATHEMGHVLGLNHTGREDSFGGDIPVMGICNYSNMEVSQDDRGNTVRLLGDLNPETIHANAGFEQGTDYWGRSSVSSNWYITSSNPSSGDFSLRFRPTANYGYVYQTMNVADVEPGTAFDARFNFRKIVSWASTGDMRVQILARRVEYGTSSSGDCEYNQFTRGGNFNQNSVNHSQYGFSVVRTEVGPPPTTSWRLTTEPTLYMPGSSWEGVDLRVRVLSSVKYTSSGNFATVNIDTTRARWRE